MRTKQTKQAAYDSALEAVKAFYGLSNGGEVALANAREALIKAKLSMDQIGDLREALPPPGAGTTGSRIQRIDRVLKRLEHLAV